MAPLIEFKNVSYTYPDAEKPVLSNFNLKVNKGQFVLIRGSSGSGKSTLLKCINGLVPSYTGGVFKGTVKVDGLDTLQNSVEKIASRVGTIFQDPENQITSTLVENELAFGLENMKFSRRKIAARIRETTRELDIKHLLKRKTSELSSGEKQKIILVSILAMQPKILLLDEPSSQLDPENTKKLNSLLSKLNKNKKTTVILVEHNFTELKKVHTIINLDGKPLARLKKPKHPGKKPGDTILTVSNLHYSYKNKKVLNNVNLQVRKGEFISIIGPNGSGKTTLLKQFNGLLKPGKGEVYVGKVNTKEAHVEDLAKKVGFLSQNPNDYLFCDTVKEELEFTLKNLGIKGNIEKTLKELGLYADRNRYPRDLSGGERQRVALASILVAKPETLVLDEPTRGIDSKSEKKLIELLYQMESHGRTIILVTHDMHLAANSDRIIVMDKGKLVEKR